MNEETPAPRPTSGARWSPPSPEHMQAMLPQYDEWSLLGCGGMGAVYKARQTSLDRTVAIKVLPPEAAEDEAEFIERFKNEARTMAKMNHPAIVAVYDFGATSDGLLYFVMEFIDGTDVSKMLQSQGKLSVEHALAITAHVCDALAYAHEHHVIHRDIKPANILINREGGVKVADFGLARMQEPGQTSGLTRSGMAMGTPDFVAPETLALGMEVDGRADLYAVGVMLYNMLTGDIPRGFFQLPSQKVGCDARFDAIIRKAMEHDVTARYQSSREIRKDLDRILTVPIAKQQQRPAGMPARPRQHVPPPAARSAPWGLITAAAMVLGGAGFFLMKRGEENPPPKPGDTAKVESPNREAAKPPPVEAKAADTKPATIAPPAPVVAQADPNAPKGSPLSKFPVLSRAGHHYQVVGEQMNFANATKHAESLGAHLATITSKEEQDWLDQVLPPYLKQVPSWMATIGAKRENGVWSWVTGEPFEYRNWELAEHADSEPERKYALKMTARSGPTMFWGCGHFDGYRAFVIEWDSTPKSTPAPMPPVVVVESDGAKRLRELETSFRAALERDVLGTHRVKLTDLNTKYLAALERALAAAMTASALPEALALRDEKLRVETSGPLPTDDAATLPASLKALRVTYRASLKPIDLELNNGLAMLYTKYGQVLTALQTELTQAGKLDDAKLAADRLGGIAYERAASGGAARELVPEGKEIVLKGSERFTSPEAYAPPVEFTIVAKTNGKNLRLAHAAKTVIFNWEVNQDELRLDNDPGGARHVSGKGRIPVDTFVTIHWRVFPHMQSISVDGERRLLHFGDYSKVSKPVEVFPADTTVTLRSLKVRAFDLKALAGRVSSVPEMKERLLDARDWSGKITIPAGTYLPFRRINVGTQGAKDSKANSTEVRCDIISEPGMRMENVRFHLLEGSWKAAGGHFRDVRITADLGGSFEARDTLFQDCVFAKEGGWFVSWFSSKWSFTNCVFTGAFMQNWRLGDVGMKLDGCTFDDVDFIPVGFKDDAGEEITKDWLSIRNCHFFNCRVPESFALATKDCVFEKCTFGEPEEKLPVKTPLSAVVQIKDTINMPKAGANRAIEARPITQLPAGVGATVPHVRAGGRLDFLTPPK